MYVIVMYDVDKKRVGKMLKLCRRYVNWIQNSVFEGALTDMQIKRLKSEANGIMEGSDSLIIFKSKDEKWLDKEIVGEEKNPLSNFL